MKNAMIAGALAFGLMGTTGCATKKYDAKVIADQGKQVAELDRDSARTKERLTDTDLKATAAGQAAQQANQAAQQSQAQAAAAARQSRHPDRGSAGTPDPGRA
jgi:hypothetical protein